MRLATWNVEWMNALFDEAGAPLDDTQPSARPGVSRREQLESLAIGLIALDADAVLIVEAPDDRPPGRTVAALEAFAAGYGLRTRRAVTGFASDSEQEIALLHDPDRLAARHDPQAAADAPRFDGAFRIDLDIDDRLDSVAFSRPPLELAVAPAAGAPFRLIGVHLKSKAPHGARSPADAMRRAIAARRKQLAQSLWLRRRVASHLAAGTPLVVLGDFNDGPGLDEYESLFGRSGVEIVAGTDDAPERRLVEPHLHRALSGRRAALPATARFYIAAEGRYLSALLDHVMVSPDLAARQGRWRIWHPLDDPGLHAVPDLREALLAASDHYPVSFDFAP